MQRNRLYVPDAGAKAYLAWLAVCVIWGTTYLANKVGIADFPPFLFTGARFLLAGLILRLFVRPAAGEAVRPWYRRVVRGVVADAGIGLSGVATLGVGVGVVVWAQQWLPSGLTAVLTAATPFWLVAMEAFVPGGTRPSRRAVAGLLLGLGGILVLALQQPPAAFRTEYLWAVATVILAGFGWAGGSIFTKRMQITGHPLAVAARQMLWAGVALLLTGLALGETLPDTVPLAGVGAFVYLVLLGSDVAYVAYLYALRHLPVALVSTHTYVNPLLALWLGWLVLAEPLGLPVLFATLLILGGLLVMKVRRPAGGLRLHRLRRPFRPALEPVRRPPRRTATARDHAEG